MRDMSSWRRPAVVVVAAALAAAGCSGGSDADSAAPPTEVKIGLLAPTSGLNKAAGEDSRRGAQLAADVVNGLNSLIPLPLAEESGLTRLGNARIKIVATDTQGSPTRGASEVSRLVADQGVSALVGAYDPEVTLAASLRAEQLEVPFVNGDSSLSFLTERGLDWFFHTSPSVRTSGEAFFSLLKAQERPDQQIRVAVLHSTDKAGIDIATVIGELVEESRYNLVRTIGYDLRAKDQDMPALLNAHVSAIKAANPDVVFIAPTARTSPFLVQAFAQNQYKPKAVMAYGSGFLGDQLLKAAGPATAGLCREAAWSYELASRNQAGRAVATLYQSKYNTVMTEEAASSFTAVLTLAMGINNAGSIDARRIRSALLSLDVPGQDTIMPWEGIRFDETHQNVGAGSVIEQFVNKSFRAVFPRDAAGGRDLIWPASNAT